jgi:hypothetical protein
MASRFRKELTTVPSVRIKVHSQGLSTTIDWNGSHAATVQGGISLSQIGDPRLSGPLPTDRFLIPGTRKDYGGGHVSDMTSPGLDRFKELLVATRQRQQDIRVDIRKAKWQVRRAWITQALGWISFACIAPPIRKRTSNALAVRRSEVATLAGNLEATRISVNFDMESEIAGPHQRMLAAFDSMAASQRSWSVQTEQNIDRVKARSWAGTVVSRAAARLGRFAASLVDTQNSPPAMGVLRGKAVAYFYPGFVLVDNIQESNFALIDITELGVASAATHFTEAESPPADAQLVGKTWAKANKNGSRDRRFTNNRELPILRYGSLNICSSGGMNEVFMFSDAEASARFAAAVNDLKCMLAKGRGRAGNLLESQKSLGRQ